MPQDELRDLAAVRDWPRPNGPTYEIRAVLTFDRDLSDYEIAILAEAMADAEKILSAATNRFEHDTAVMVAMNGPQAVIPV